MKRLFRLLSIAVVFGTIVTFTSVRPAAAACVVFDMTGPVPFGSLPTIAGHHYTLYRDGIFDSTFTSTGETLTGSIPAGLHVVWVDSDADCPGNASQPLFSDGRVNRNDAIQTAAVYCGVPKAGDVRVYALFNNVGTLAFTMTKAELAAGVQKPAMPYLIKSAKGAELWRLQDSSLRIKRGTYVFDWPGC